MRVHFILSMFKSGSALLALQQAVEGNKATSIVFLQSLVRDGLVKPNTLKELLLSPEYQKWRINNDFRECSQAWGASFSHRK